MTKYITQQDICEMMKVNVSTVWRWRKQGLPYIRIRNGHIRFLEEEVVKWVQENKQEA